MSPETQGNIDPIFVEPEQLSGELLRMRQNYPLAQREILFNFPQKRITNINTLKKNPVLMQMFIEHKAKMSAHLTGHEFDWLDQEFKKAEENFPREDDPQRNIRINNGIVLLNKIIEEFEEMKSKEAKKDKKIEFDNLIALAKKRININSQKVEYYNDATEFNFLQKSISKDIDSIKSEYYSDPNEYIKALQELSIKINEIIRRQIAKIALKVEKYKGDINKAELYITLGKKIEKFQSDVATLLDQKISAAQTKLKAKKASTTH